MGASDGPMILCGPIVRRATADDGVSVFVATRAPCELTLTLGQGAAAVWQGQPNALGRQRTARVGQGLHLAVVTARPVNAGLAWGETYHYDLQVEADGVRGGFGQPDVLVAGPAGFHPPLARLIAQSNEQLPSVVLPPADPAALRVITGSCRKPHGAGHDGLALADELIRASVLSGAGRPHQLVLSGDQIYADDVNLHLLGAATHLGDDLVGGGELTALRARYGGRLAPADRKTLVQAEGGLTTSAGGHLVTFAEFCAMYLLAWSDQVWPDDLAERSGSAEVRSFRDALPDARRALANVATYMMFDDHEITDDWALRLRWNRSVLQTDLGRRVIRNGLAAYALFQHWGNQPEAFEPGGPGAALLALLDGVDGGVSPTHEAELDRLLGLPPPAERELDRWADAQTAHALRTGQPVPFRWGYAVEAPGYRLVALDGRTRRQFPGEGLSLMSAADIDNALPLAQERSDLALQVVVAPAPVLGLKLIEGVQEAVDGHYPSAVEYDAEPWAVSPTLNHLLRRLLDGPPTVILSGDVHYGFASVLDGTGSRAGRRVVNLVASALKNDGMGQWTAWFLDGQRLEANQPGDDAAKPLLQAAQRTLEADGDAFVVALLDADGAPAAADAFTLEKVGDQDRSPLVSLANLGEVCFEQAGRVTLRLHYRHGGQHKRTEQAPRFPLGAR